MAGGPKSQLTTIVVTGSMVLVQVRPNAVESLLRWTLAPKLKQVKISSLGWPNNQHDIEKSRWVALSEAMWAQLGVRLVDWKGVWWTPRPKVQNAKKKK
ncbi:hypothetical protein BKA70DRAFT_1446802 [Coprinopsis sp. MPI-PUGE-AT-0042]|nr:hypothetical protein BKA70DRAFT_1446802 [Coprinopsis sp. MPI-PUGE-AT-0042]